jgi:hypothetical protein
MPKVRDVTCGGTLEGDENTMSDGTKTFEVKGFRSTVTSVYDWVPQNIINDLVSMLRSGKYFTVSYPDPDGTDRTALMSVDPPESKVYKYVGTVPYWHNVTLKMSA